jgi:hypothetical protein
LRGIFVYLFCAAFFAGCLATVNAGTRLQELEQANAILASDRLFELLEIAHRNQWKMWALHSEWAIARMPVGEDKLVAERAAAFGGALSRQLDRLALALRSPVANRQDEQTAFWLAELSRWIASSHGSGNALLAERSLDLATLPLARLVLNGETTASRLQEYRTILTPDWAGVVYRAEVLNAESGRRVFDPKGTSEELTSAYEREAGASVWKMLAKAGLNPDSNPLLKSLPHPDSAQDQTGFFEHEDLPAQPTTTNILGMKNAGMVAAGLADGNARDLLALIDYRLRAGHLPDVPQGKEASRVFDDAWKAQLTLAELKNDELRTLGGTAGRAFERIKTGQFIDQDSFYSRRSENADLLPLSIPDHIPISKSTTEPSVELPTTKVKR